MRVTYEKKNKKVILKIWDNGTGIKEEELPRIFEKGFTGQNGRMVQQSTGIGLYLCRQVFTHLNVTIRAESQEGQGTRIILGIPNAEKSPRP